MLFFLDIQGIQFEIFAFRSQKRECIKIAKKLLLGAVISRKVQRGKAFVHRLPFSRNTDLRYVRHTDL
jgi:hypothetical protein